MSLNERPNWQLQTTKQNCSFTFKIAISRSPDKWKWQLAIFVQSLIDLLNADLLGAGIFFLLIKYVSFQSKWSSVRCFRSAQHIVRSFFRSIHLPSMRPNWNAKPLRALNSPDSLFRLFLLKYNTAGFIVESKVFMWFGAKSKFDRF